MAGALSYAGLLPLRREAANVSRRDSMKVSNTLVNITSENPEKLMKFYTDVVGLPKNPNMGDSAVDAGGTTLGFDGHSKIQGATKEPERVLIDFFVDDIASEQKRLEGAGVKFIRSQGKEYWGGIISTFADPDGNLVQLIEYRPEEPSSNGGSL
jgi:predicted enzyme related to lactoylglutathione lyase